MKRTKLHLFISLTKKKSIQFLIGVAILYLLIMVRFESSFVFKSEKNEQQSSTNTLFFTDGSSKESFALNTEEEEEEEEEEEKSPIRPRSKHIRKIRKYKPISNLNFNVEFGGIQSSAKEAVLVGKRFWEEIQSISNNNNITDSIKNETIENCPESITLSGSDFRKKGNIIVLPCGMTLGTHVTLVGNPREAHFEKDPKISLLKQGEVSQFMMELQGLKTVDGEDPPRILHFNPRLKGDWSGKPVIELNTCYRMQWGIAHRCEGWKSRVEEETVDGKVKCEKWIRDDDGHLKDSKANWWLKRVIGRTKMTIDWPFPFSEKKLFVLTLSAGLEGYHIDADGRHIASFPYRIGFALEDATGLALKGDIDVHTILVASLPSTNPSFAPQKHLEMSQEWKAPPPPNGPTDLFIGILSAGNHFAERMAVRKSWMQHHLIKSSHVVARFFVALNARKEVNVELKKEADFFGDIVIVPYMDHYDLVVLKTFAICEYGVRTASAKYIMKCDDDTFVRVDIVLNEANKVGDGKSMYAGNINYYHQPLRYGKWAVTYEEWPGEDYPPYANGPGYVISSDIAEFIASEFEKHKLKLFKMEDVSMGMWVEQFNKQNYVNYIHSLNYCQFGCIQDYYTAHYQSPRQMLCLWNKLQLGRPECCNMR